MTTKHLPIAAALAVTLLSLGLCSAQDSPARNFPETSTGIHVFNDQIDVSGLTEAQVQFVATHYAGAQKLTAAAVERLRAHNPAFIMLQYRLGVGLGFRTPDDQCLPTGDWLAVPFGDDWRQEWPEDGNLPEEWFFHYQGQRVFACDWGWYLMDPDQPGWRDWWLAEVDQQLEASHADGLFADSVSVPTFLGADRWRPALPASEASFEADWTARLDRWMAWARTALGSNRSLIVNAGALVTTRETTDYTLVAGVMVEGFAGWSAHDRFMVGDWRLQMERILHLTSLDRVVILQSYVSAPDERLWTLANYLLVKGNHTFINLETSQNAEWFPEYDLAVGAPLSPAPSSIEHLIGTDGLYVREYAGALVLVNPDPEGSPQHMDLEAPLYWVSGTIGGGDIPPSANIEGWGVQTTPVTEIIVQPGQAAILLREPPQGSLNAPPSQRALTPTSVAAFHRSGQTFVTWPETSTDPLQTYRVFRHSVPFSDAVLNREPVATLPQGSGIFWTDRARAMDPPYEDGDYISLRSYVITDDGPQLPDGTGLLVWTTHEEGSFYYTVVTDDGTTLGTAGPILEHVDNPAPVRVWRSTTGFSQVFTQFMDYASYNPTFDAPRAGNAWLGLSEWQELERGNNHQQYAYNYWVGLPTPALCEGRVPDPLPLVLHLEGWGSRYAAPADALYWCAVHLWADDPSQSWYYGFSATHDYRLDAPVQSGPIVNFTEARLLRAVAEVLRDSQFGTIDPARVYVYGHSMGGTGALMLAERYPQVFAAAAASEPMMDFGSAALWVGELEGKWGTRALNLPIVNRGPEAHRLTVYDGTGVWDWQNLGEQLSKRRGDEMAFIAVAHGTRDEVIDWLTVARPAYVHFQAGNRGFIGEILEQDHTWLGFREHPNWIFNRMDFRRDETFPALANASASLPVLPDTSGGYNLTLEWSASNNDFAGLPVDSPGEWTIVLRSLSGEQTVDVTPRRAQQFAVEVGQTYSWTNLQLPSGDVIQAGTVTSDADGLLVISGFLVTPNGNRLVITLP